MISFPPCLGAGVPLEELSDGSHVHDVVCGSLLICAERTPSRAVEGALGSWSGSGARGRPALSRCSIRGGPGAAT